MIDDTQSTRVTSDRDFSDAQKKWTTEIDLALREFKPWRDEGEKVVKIYRDERKNADIERDDERKTYNLFWSNVQTLIPALYARTPKPEIERRFRDKDPVGAMASEILRRCTEYVLETSDFDDANRAAVQDRLLPGRGQVWIRYEPHIKQTQSLTPLTAGDDGGYYMPDGSRAGDDAEVVEQDDGQIAMAEQVEELEYEEIHVDYVYWRDFLHNPARNWGEVRWCARRSYLTRDELTARFGKDGKSVPLNHNSRQKTDDDDTDERENEVYDKAEIWEIWDRIAKKVHWVCLDHDDVIQSVPDPLRLKHFFPCPAPLYATTTTDTLVPVADWHMYRSQLTELTELTQRVEMLTQSIRVTGLYNGEMPAAEELIEGGENKLYPVDDWAAFAEKGGTKGAVDYLPIDVIAKVRQSLNEARDRIKQEIYEITGLADIIRGASNPNETATAQRIKGQFATLRLQDHQREQQRFARDQVRIAAEIIAEHFQPETMMLISNIKLPTREEQDQARMVLQQYQQMQMPQQPGQPPAPPPPQVTQAQSIIGQINIDDVVDLLRSEQMRCFRIDIETDSTLLVDQQEEKQTANEFVGQIGGLLQQMVPAMQSFPALSDALGATVMFALRAYPKGRALEPQFEAAMQQMAQQAKAPRPPDPRIAIEQQKAQSDTQEAQAKMQLAEQKAQAEIQLKQWKAQKDAEIEQMKVQFEFQMKELEAKMKAQLAANESYGVTA